MAVTFIKSGEWIVQDKDFLIRTDLGSCVAICLWDSALKIGGMNHYLLPTDAQTAASELITGMLQKGAAVWSMQGAIIGGGQLDFSMDHFRIGDNNVDAAETVLMENRIPLVYKRVGGAISRSVEMDVAFGLIKVSEIRMGSGTMNHYRHQFMQRS